MIPYVIIFDNHNAGDKIEEDDYGSVTEFTKLRKIVKNIIRYHVERDDMHDTFEDFCGSVPDIPYYDNVYFDMKYYDIKNDKWIVYDVEEVARKHWNYLKKKSKELTDI
jgi:hypothetical protein